MKIKTGIFGGTFNPIHIGHLALANYICEFEALDELWFLVTPQNPLRQGSDFLDNNKRLELVKLAIEGYPKFVASDFEFHLPKPSYSCNTLDELKKAYPEREFVLIIGADNWLIFDKWKDYQRIIDENEIWIYPRPGSVVDKSTLPPSVKLTNVPEIDICSTFIRDGIKKGKDVRYFMHPAVYKKIKEEGYFI
ncbi:nicotinate (nicotinamide) nucleotide adenylyltransferase [uncultured Bacteroides sp.]|uniref:nicotinate (nicotinamide) nucleotide adenylyltransferase n=1 Tax=uncultured Bacteroides sp. TaxID=162156 RepID=UPI002AAC1006|nr:nicotinate (nicotinamide) nucleotide adenylyltransferase [uncultured Bacteroides sp.]